MGLCGSSNKEPAPYSGPTVPDEPVVVNLEESPKASLPRKTPSSPAAPSSTTTSLGSKPLSVAAPQSSGATQASGSASTRPAAGSSVSIPAAAAATASGTAVVAAPGPPGTPPRTPNPNKPARPKDSNRGAAAGTPWDPETLQAKRNFHELYKLGEMIGEGNYSEVYSAIELATGTEVAVKVVDKSDLDESDIREIKGEVSILGELDHPNIIRLFGFFEDDRKFYICTEMMKGGELFDEIVDREFFWERDAQEVIKTLAAALAYMHSRGIVHRDLKPENILLTTKDKKTAVVKLADFGFAVRTDPARLEYQLTTACGTPGYVAPEIVAGVKYGPEVDMWALGVIAFILLAGYPPFHDEDQNELFRMIRRGKFTFDPAYWGVVSQTAKDVVKGLICVDRGKRLKAADLLKHPWIVDLPEEVTKTLPGGTRLEGMEGRGGAGSINLSPALRELKKFQARRRWKDNMMLALAREGQVLGNAFEAGALMTEIPTAADRPGVRGVDISTLGGLGTSEMLSRLLVEKRNRMASSLNLSGPPVDGSGASYLSGASGGTGGGA